MPKKEQLIFLLTFCVIGLFIIIAGYENPDATRIVSGEAEYSSEELVYARPADAKTLDPAYACEPQSAKIIVNIYEGLVRFSPGKNKIEPALAEKWEVSENGKTWTFHLRKGVYFHDGTVFDAKTVKFNVERQLPPQKKPGMAYADFTFGMVDKVEVVDDLTVKFHLKYPFAPFLYNLAMPYSAPMASPTAIKKYGNLFYKNPVGTGPFKLENWEKDRRMVLAANKNYWNDPAVVSRVIINIIPESKVRMEQLLNGSADIIDGLDIPELELLEEEDQLVVSTTRNDISYLGFYTDKPPFNSAKLRKAISMAINREKLAESLFRNKLAPANGPLPPTIMSYSPELKPYPYNPETAKQLINEAGYESGLKMTLLTYTSKRPYNPLGGEKLAEFIKEDLEKIGIDVTIKTFPWDEFKNAVHRKEGDAFLYGWVGDNGDPDNFLHMLFATSQIETGLNASRYSNSRLDFLLAAAQQEIDPKLRESLYLQAQQIIIQEAPWVFLNYGMEYAAVSPHVGGFVLQPNGFSYLYSVYKKSFP